MNLKGRYFLSNLLIAGIVFCLAAVLAGGLFGAPQETEKAEGATLSFDAGLDVLNEDIIQALNEKLEEEAADMLLSVQENERTISTSTRLGDSSTAMAGLAIVTENIETEDYLNEYARTLLTSSAEDEAEAQPDEQAAEQETAAEEAETESPEESLTAFEQLFTDKLMANPQKLATEALNIRKTAGMDGEVIGKLYIGAWATIVAEEAEWFQIQSGNVSGWVAKDYVLTGREAAALAADYGYYQGTVTTERLNVRNAASVEAECIGQALSGECYAVVAHEGDWTAITFRGTVCYVASEYLSEQYVMSTAMTLEEERAWLAEQERIARDNQVAQAIEASAARGGTNRGITYISYDDARLLACVVDMEAGGQSYEERLAVANVILNRYYSGIWGYSFSGIIYSPGQFTGANTGLLASFLSAGPSSGSLQAVYDACAGYNNIGGYMYFCSLGKAGSVNSAGGTYLGNMYLYVQR